MTDDRLRTLWADFLAGRSLASQEKLDLLAALRSDERLRDDLMLDWEVHRTLHGRGRSERDASGFERAFARGVEAVLDESRFVRQVEQKIENGGGPRPPTTRRVPADEGNALLHRPPSTRRATRRGRSSEPQSYLAPILAAAGVIAAITLLLVLSPSERDPAASRGPKEARARASHQEAEARSQAERDRLERDQALAEAQARLLAAEAHLREIEEKRKVLTQGKPEAQEDPQIKAKREKDLETLKRDQERIEQELREAAQLAKKTAPPAPAQPPQEGKPQSAPAALSQGTTQAALAKVEEVAGDAFVVTKDGKSPATVGVDLIAGQGLETGGGASRIVLRLTDKTRVDLGPDSVLAELKLDSGKRIALTRGTVRAVVAKQPKGEPLIFTTPHGQATVVGTTLRLYVDPDPKKGTRLEVEEGKVELKNLAGKTVMVESGHYAVAAVGVELVARVGGSLTTSEGTWTFGGLAPDGISYYIQLNGAVVGWAAEMEIVGGSLYSHNTVGGHWFRWQNGAWVDIGTTAPSSPSRLDSRRRLEPGRER